MTLPEDDAIAKRHHAVARSGTFRRIREAFGLEKKRVMDAGCGYGEYLALFGAGSVGITTTPHEVAFGERQGLTIVQGNVERLEALNLAQKFEAVWANNLFEHLLSPHAFLINLKTVVERDGLVILGVPVVPKIASLMRLRHFRGALASNHINFFTRRTLRLTLERSGWAVVDIRPFILQVAFLDRLLAPFAPHLYAVALNDTAFSYPPKKLKEWGSDPLYARLLAIIDKRPL